MREGSRKALPGTEELRIRRAFIETTEALRSELAARLQSESSLSPGHYAVLLTLRPSSSRRRCGRVWSAR